MNTFCRRSAAFLGLFLVVAVWMIASVSLPDAAAQDEASRPAFPAARILSARQAEVTIDIKTPEGIRVGVDRYLVTPATLIVTGDGEEVAYENLPVPCTARLFFEPSLYRDPEVLKIQVISVALGAGTDWSPVLPE